MDAKFKKQKNRERESDEWKESKDAYCKTPRDQLKIKKTEMYIKKLTSSVQPSSL